jgi:hypothetical protein
MSKSVEALMDIHWNQLPEEIKDGLRRQLAQND